MPFTTLASVKQALRIPVSNTDSDDLLNGLIDEIHAVILEDIGGGLSAATLTSYTQKFDINQTGFRGLRLPKWPVGSVSSVKTGTNKDGAGQALLDNEWYVTPEGTLRLEAASAYWPPGKQNVEVTWTAGFTEGAKDYMSLALAERMTVCEQYNTIAAAGRKSERIGNYSYSLAGKSDRGHAIYPPIAARIISRYRTIFGIDNIVP